MRFITTGKPVFVYQMSPEDAEKDRIEAVRTVLDGMSSLIA